MVVIDTVESIGPTGTFGRESCVCSPDIDISFIRGTAEDTPDSLPERGTLAAARIEWIE
jgi:hypothetical protein